MSARGVTVMVHRDGALETRQFRLSAWATRAAFVLTITLIVTLVLVAVLYGPIVVAAARTPMLVHEVEQLRIENARVNELARRLDEVEARYAQMRRMLAGNVNLPGPSNNAAPRAADEGLYVAPPLLARAPAPGEAPASAVEPEGASIPRKWPLSVPSYRTRGLAEGDPGTESHAGIDLAVPIGSDVRASGGGRVSLTGTDSAYGLYVVIQHSDGYETKYGHLSRIIAAQGEAVRTGQVIGLSGNSGRSTAPHLHFEIRRGGRSVDPLSLVKEGN
ncbi:MAG: peptidoglycan DD-metalloendopeptidase family protein [Gemmatimonadales bacterium]